MELIYYNAHSRRVWICGQRVHHGTVGTMLVAMGLCLCLHDRQDINAWFHREAPSE